MVVESVTYSNFNAYFVITYRNMKDWTYQIDVIETPRFFDFLNMDT